MATSTTTSVGGADWETWSSQRRSLDSDSITSITSFASTESGNIVVTERHFPRKSPATVPRTGGSDNKLPRLRRGAPPVAPAKTVDERKRERRRSSVVDSLRRVVGLKTPLNPALCEGWWDFLFCFIGQCLELFVPKMLSLNRLLGIKGEEGIEKQLPAHQTQASVFGIHLYSESEDESDEVAGDGKAKSKPLSGPQWVAKLQKDNACAEHGGDGCLKYTTGHVPLLKPDLSAWTIFLQNGYTSTTTPPPKLSIQAQTAQTGRKVAPTQLGDHPTVTQSGSGSQLIVGKLRHCAEMRHSDGRSIPC
ncbi:hypothetical protein C8F04DRAFT_1289458 [Mycena alexandri]|uniref:Uncharacterized protein n=1 Tax=Mycena alexandri TaxID=1745969 RepID=A0AAD6SJP3_9AGAR|nr:hypothetical protein C8F04DRAFT_1289458 [Mycena alexandri]